MLKTIFLQRGHTVTKYVERELMNHSDLLHPHIVQFKEVFLTTDYLAIVMEYAAGGDMFQHVKSRRGLSEDEVSYLSNLMRSLSHPLPSPLNHSRLIN